jgi:hypothetical protein
MSQTYKVETEFTDETIQDVAESYRGKRLSPKDVATVAKYIQNNFEVDFTDLIEDALEAEIPEEEDEEEEEEDK